MGRRERKQAQAQRARDAAVARAQSALQRAWQTGHPAELGEAAAALRALPLEVVQLLGAWVPAGTGATAVKCSRVRELVRGVAVEKGAT